MKKTKSVLLTICFLVISCALFSFGVYAASPLWVETNGMVKFDFGDVYASVTGSVSYLKPENGYPTYTSASDAMADVVKNGQLADSTSIIDKLQIFESYDSDFQEYRIDFDFQDSTVWVVAFEFESLDGLDVYATINVNTDCDSIVHTDGNVISFNKKKTHYIVFAVSDYFSDINNASYEISFDFSLTDPEPYEIVGNYNYNIKQLDYRLVPNAIGVGTLVKYGKDVDGSDLLWVVLATDKGRATLQCIDVVKFGENGTFQNYESSDISKMLNYFEGNIDCFSEAEQAIMTSDNIVVPRKDSYLSNENAIQYYNNDKPKNDKLYIFNKIEADYYFEGADDGKVWKPSTDSAYWLRNNTDSDGFCQYVYPPSYSNGYLGACSLTAPLSNKVVPVVTINYDDSTFSDTSDYKVVGKVVDEKSYYSNDYVIPTITVGTLIEYGVYGKGMYLPEGTPIEWRVLAITSGQVTLHMTAPLYSDVAYGNSDYLLSKPRELCLDFQNSNCFTKKQKSLMQPFVKVADYKSDKTSNATKYGQVPYNNIATPKGDYVYCLNLREADYFYGPTTGDFDASGLNNNFWWWTRSPLDENSCMVVNGDTNTIGYLGVTNTEYAVCVIPAVTIAIKI